MLVFTVLTAVALPLEIPQIDTGSILPGRFMRRHRRPGNDYSDAFLHDLRFDEMGAPRHSFPLNQPQYRQAKILVSGAEFGCGSAREAAVYALMDYGFKALIGVGFADMFYNNCLQNGVLPVVLPEATIREIWATLRRAPGAALKIDLRNQTVTDSEGDLHTFEINPRRKECLLQGIDDIDLTLEHASEIAAYEAARRRKRPWWSDRSKLPSSLDELEENT